MNGLPALPVYEIRELLAGEEPVVPQRILEIIAENKLFRLFLPESFGGLQMSLRDALPVIEHCAAIDGAFGWMVQIGAGGGFFAGFLPVKTAQPLMSRPDFVIAGSGFPGGTAVRENGGYRITEGRWNWCSGADYATLFTANCRISGSDEIRAFAFLPEQVRIEKTWDAFGLIATSSDTLHVQDIFVPDDMSFSVSRPVDDHDYGLFHQSFSGFARAVLMATALGNFRHFFDEVKNADPDELDEKAARAEALLGERSAGFYRAVEKMEEGMGDDHSLAALIDDSVSRLFAEASALYFRCGMIAVQRSHPLSKTWRDLSVTIQHSLLKQEHRYDPS
ncbi:MAG: hypothetical protein INR69_01125 [Mucilaginibacter polytrichastri]|nr:hypothetical protein [Mucilaginibacter polytrichastri]